MPLSVVVSWARHVGKWLPQVQTSWKSDRRWAVKLVDYLLDQGFMSSRNSSGTAAQRLALLVAGSHHGGEGSSLGSEDAQHFQSMSGNTWRSSQSALGWVCVTTFRGMVGSSGTAGTKLPLDIFRDRNIIPM